MKGFLAAAILLAASLRPAVAGAEPNRITVTYGFPKPVYVSTETANLKLTIVNHSANAARIFARSVLYTTYSGEITRPMVMTCSLGCFLHVDIPPGTTTQWSFPLPSCHVIADPCTVQTGAEYHIDYIGGGGETRRVKVPAYRFIADPNVAFKDVPDGRPVYVGIGKFDSSLEPSTLLIAVSAAPNGAPRPYDPTAYVAEVVKILKDDRVAIDHTNAGLDDPKAWRATGWSNAVQGSERRLPLSDDDTAATWRAQIYVKNATGQRAAIARGLTDLRRHLGGSFDKITERFVLNVQQEDPASWSYAKDDAGASVTHLLETLHGGDLAFYPFSQSAIELRFVPGWDGTDGPYDADELGWDQIVLLAPADLQDPPTVKYSEEVAWIGSTPIEFQPNSSLTALAKTAFVDPEFPHVGRAVTIAADQPELYAAGAASMAASLAAGISPYLAAFVHARQNLATFARAIGVKLGSETLYTMYSHPNDDVQKVGIAAKFEANDAEAWQSNSEDGDVRVSAWADPRSQTMVPIGVEDELFANVQISEATPRWTASHVRVAFQLDSNADAVIVDTQALLARIQRLVHPALAVVRTADGGKKARYEVVVKRSELAAAEGLISLLRSAYAPFNAALGTDVNAYAFDCDAVTGRLIRAGMRANWKRAGSDAATAHQRLRGLVLAAVLWTSVHPESCGPLSPTTDDLTGHDFSYPFNPDTLPISVVTLDEFRTAPDSPR